MNFENWFSYHCTTSTSAWAKLCFCTEILKSAQGNKCQQSFYRPWMAFAKPQGNITKLLNTNSSKPVATPITTLFGSSSYNAPRTLGQPASKLDQNGHILNLVEQNWAICSDKKLVTEPAHTQDPSFLFWNYPRAVNDLGRTLHLARKGISTWSFGIRSWQQQLEDE